MNQKKHWWEVLSVKNQLHWVKNDRSGAMWPEIFPTMETVLSSISAKDKAKRRKRNKTVRNSRRKNR